MPQYVYQLLSYFNMKISIHACNRLHINEYAIKVNLKVKLIWEIKIPVS